MNFAGNRFKEAVIYYAEIERDKVYRRLPPFLRDAKIFYFSRQIPESYQLNATVG